jgi:hypothetical protein
MNSSFCVCFNLSRFQISVRHDGNAERDERAERDEAVSVLPGTSNRMFHMLNKLDQMAHRVADLKKKVKGTLDPISS